MVFALCILVIFLADVIKPPSIVPSDSGGVVVSTKGGDRRWVANWTMEPITREGKKAIRFTEKGQGHVSPYSGEVRWTLEAVWSAENGLRPVSTEKNVTSLTGARVAIERKHFDLTKNVVRFERQFPDGRSEEKSLSIPPDTLAVEGIAGVLRFLPFNQLSQFSAHLLSNEPRLYSVTFEMRGKERVRTPAGDFNAYKVEMVPHLGVLNVFRSFASKAFFWFNVEEPHFWVRYQGVENGPGTPEIVMELDRMAQ
jgi:Protein of unknown function (DUF3108)